jgi:outer membrane immunogenic protein
MRKNVQTVTTELVYRFNWTGPSDAGTHTGSLLAADLALKAPRLVPPPVIRWTGCYVGGGVGYGMWSQDHYTETDPLFISLTSSATTGGEGWLGRAGGGCDYQFAVGNLGNFVVGILGDYDFESLSGTIQDTVSGLLGNEKQSGAWAVGARAGYLVTPGLLPYVDAGYTQAHYDPIGLATNVVPPVPTIFSITANTYQGWFLGGGTEYALNMDWIPIPGLFWRTEYRYSSYASADVPILPLTLIAEKMQNNVQTVTTSLVWRFNWPGGWH